MVEDFIKEMIASGNEDVVSDVDDFENILNMLDEDLTEEVCDSTYTNNSINIAHCVSKTCKEMNNRKANKFN